MTVRLTAPPWSGQPQEVARVDWANPLTASLLGITCGGQGERAAGGLPVYSGGFALQPGPGGLGPTYVGVGSMPGFCASLLDRPRPYTGDHTVMVFASGLGETGTTETNQFEITPAGSATATNIRIGATAVTFVIDNNPSSALAGDYSRPTLFVGVRVGNQARAYTDGAFRQSWTTGTRNGSLTGLVAGRRTGNNAANLTTYMMAVWDRALSDAEILRLGSNPWQLFEPQSIWVPVSGEAPAPEPIQPPLLTNGQAFFGPSVGRGAIALSAPLLSNTGLLYAASVGRGSIALSPPLLSNAQTLFAPAVTSVGAALRPPLLTNTSTAYAPEVTRGAVALTAPLLANTSEMLAPAVGSGSATISPPLLASGAVVHAPSVQAGAVALSAPLLASAGSVYAPSVSAGAVQVLPPLLASTQIFYAPSVTGGAAAIRPLLLVNTSEFYAPVVTVGDVTIVPPLLLGGQIFYPPTVGDEPLPIIDSAFLRYVVPGKSLAFSVPGQSLTYSVPQ